MPPEKQALTPELARLVFLLNEYRIQIPGTLQRYLPYWRNWLPALYQGLGTAADTGAIPLQQLTELYQQGQALGPGSREEGLTLVALAIQQSIKQEQYPLPVLLQIYRALDVFMTDIALLEVEEEINLGALEGPLPGVQKWNSNFVPLDLVLGGLYQGILVIVGAPGIGKTSLMLSLQEEMVRTNVVDATWFFQNEIPAPMLLGRMSQGPLRRTTYRETDLLICGTFGVERVLEKMREEGQDIKPAVFFDSPDVVTGGDPRAERRFHLESAYQKLIQIKQRSEIVVVSSQPNRRSARLPQLDGLAEAWSKAWYADMVVGLSHATNVFEDTSSIRLEVLKNRFGPSGNRLVFRYNYMDLSWFLVEGEQEDLW